MTSSRTLETAVPTRQYCDGLKHARTQKGDEMSRHDRPEAPAQGVASRWWHRTGPIAVGLVILFAAVGSPPQVLGQGLIAPLNKACEKELAMYCKDVTSEQGRVLACLYAHGNGLSAPCEYVMYELLNQLETAILPTVRLMKACDQDAHKHCPLVELGEGRVTECLKRNSALISPACRQALAGTGSK
jgi:hypothetical protein